MSKDKLNTDVIHDVELVQKAMFYVDPYELDWEGHPSMWKMRFAQFMIIWSVVSQVFLLIAALEIFQAKMVEGVSLSSYILYLLGNVVWFFYGIWVLSPMNKPLVWSSVVAFALTIVILVGIGIYS